jgi:hypothetical protein
VTKYPENKVPPLGSRVRLKNGTIGTVVCGWYEDRKWHIKLEIAGKGKIVFLKDIYGPAL